MKPINILFVLLLSYSISSCLKDEGTYEYHPPVGPVFLMGDYPSVSCLEGDTAFLRGNFRYEDVDSIEKLKDLTYEWSLYGKVLSEEMELSIPTDTIMKKIGLTAFPSGTLTGAFTVIEKSTGLRFIQKVSFKLEPLFSRGQWLILSENGNNSRLSYQRFSQKYVGNQLDSIYTNYQDIYQEVNGESIPGKPVRLVDHGAKNISVAGGATLVLTDQVAYEVNNENFTKALDLKDEFIDGTPDGFRIADAYYYNRVTLLAAADGRVFRRLFTENYLGGRFMREPYSVDEKGSEIAFFGNGGKDVSLILAYDRLNNRLLMINQFYTPVGAIMPLQAVGSGHSVQPWDLGPDVKVHAISAKEEAYAGSYYSKIFCMVYSENGKNYMADIVVDNNPPAYYGNVINSGYSRKIELSGVSFDEDSRFLITSAYGAGSYAQYILYTKGNEIRYINRSTGADQLFISFPAKVKAMHYAIVYNRHKELAVGLANGDFMRVDISDRYNPKVVAKSVFNVGGEIVDISNTGGREHYAQ